MMLQVFILTYNRPNTLIIALDSVLKQNFTEYEIIISDNSTNDESKSLISKRLYKEKNLTYIKREPSLPAIEHFNKVLSEVSEEYFMLFHDDDIMKPSMIQNLYDLISKDKEISAVGCNAQKINRKRRSGYFRKNNERIIRYNNRSEFILSYLGTEGCAVFPGYMYRSQLVRGLKMDFSIGGKYSDVTFLMSVCDRGSILVTNKALMNYYIHKGQDSMINDYLSKKSFISHIANTTIFYFRHPLVKSYRIENVLSEILSSVISNTKPISLKKYVLVMVLSLKYSKKQFFRSVYYLPKFIKNKL